MGGWKTEIRPSDILDFAYHLQRRSITRPPFVRASVSSIDTAVDGRVRTPDGTQGRERASGKPDPPCRNSRFLVWSRQPWKPI